MYTRSPVPVSALFACTIANSPIRAPPTRGDQPPEVAIPFLRSTATRLAYSTM
jgi:hypothetical protein